MRVIIVDEAPVPESFVEAINGFRPLLASRGKLSQLDRDTFLRGWAGLSYIAPGLHPDEFDNPEGGWPVGWRCIAQEAFRRSEEEGLADGELYAWRAAKAGLGLPWEVDE